VGEYRVGHRRGDGQPVAERRTGPAQHLGRTGAVQHCGALLGQRAQLAALGDGRHRTGFAAGAMPTKRSVHTRVHEAHRH